MKKIISILFLAFLSIGTYAQDAELSKAADFYKNGQYAEAVQLYEGLLLNSGESSELYYNLANAYYKNEQNASAILNYERALLLNPNNDDAKFNLEMANAKKLDKINDIGEFFVTDMIQAMANWMSSNTWAIVSICLFIVALLLAAVYAFMQAVTLRKIGFIGTFVALIFSLFSFFMSSVQKSKLENREYAIVMAPSVTITSTPDEKGTKLFVLHEGVKLKVLSTLEAWVEIKLADGSIGWMRSNLLERI